MLLILTLQNTRVITQPRTIRYQPAAQIRYRGAPPAPSAGDPAPDP